MGESCAVTCTEGYQAANETSGALMWAYDEVTGVRLRDRSACPSFVRLMTRQQVPLTSFVTFHIRAVVWSLARRVMKLVGIFQQLCPSAGEFFSEAQTVHSSRSQTLCSDTQVQSGVGANSSCEDVFIGDTCMMFRSRRERAIDGTILFVFPSALTFPSVSSLDD